jgi:hypothetical protein
MLPRTLRSRFAKSARCIDKIDMRRKAAQVGRLFRRRAAGSPLFRSARARRRGCRREPIEDRNTAQARLSVAVPILLQDEHSACSSRRIRRLFCSDKFFERPRSIRPGLSYPGPGERQPRPGATCFRIASRTWALYSTPSWFGTVRSSVSASAMASSFLSCSTRTSGSAA